VNKDSIFKELPLMSYRDNDNFKHSVLGIPTISFQQKQHSQRGTTQEVPRQPQHVIVDAPLLCNILKEVPPKRYRDNHNMSSLTHLCYAGGVALFCDSKNPTATVTGDLSHGRPRTMSLTVTVTPKWGRLFEHCDMN